jgi:hypothetical protein
VTDLAREYVNGEKLIGPRDEVGSRRQVAIASKLHNLPRVVRPVEAFLGQVEVDAPFFMERAPRACPRFQNS